MQAVGLEPGDPAPEFRIQSLSGQVLTRQDLLGQPTHLLILRHLG